MCQFWRSLKNLYLCEPCGVFLGHFRIGSHVTSTLFFVSRAQSMRFGDKTFFVYWILTITYLLHTLTKHSSKSKPSSGQIFFVGQLASGKWKIASVPMLARELFACGFLFWFWSGRVNRHIGYEGFGCSQRHLVNNTVHKYRNADALQTCGLVETALLWQ